MGIQLVFPLPARDVNGIAVNTVSGHGVPGSHQGTPEAAGVRRHEEILELRAEITRDTFAGTTHLHVSRGVQRTTKGPHGTF